ncbi:hypothetical protein EV363DRAFT_1153897 [Boletus edulis]|nr:hypothetical protein EV363DRAFT_1153897 [Boletus edulis]
MLLYNEAIWEEDEELYGRICNSCWEDVVIGKVPSTALANNLWIGNVPQELAILSLTERVLVARYHPRAQIVKLYPRSRSSYTSGGLSFNSGLRGNVSSYHLNSDEIARMVDGELLPHHPRILAAVIGVSIVGAHHGSDRPLPAMLNVNRERVRDALRFLKANNPFYVDIRLSETNLMLLPEEGVPDELLGVIRETLDTDNLEKEHSGYGAEDDDDYNTDEVERVIGKYLICVAH